MMCNALGHVVCAYNLVYILKNGEYVTSMTCMYTLYHSRVGYTGVTGIVVIIQYSPLMYGFIRIEHLLDYTKASVY